MGLEVLNPLLGVWRDESRTGEPGSGRAGGETWEPALGGRVVVREAWYELSGSPSPSTVRHEELLVVFVDLDSELRAIGWDNEGQVTRYREVEADPDGRGVGFVSDPTAPGPRRWLQLRFEEPHRLSGVLSLHRSGEPTFSPYLRWTSVRAPPPSA